MTQKTSTGKPLKGTITNAYIVDRPVGQICVGQWGLNHVIRTSLIVSTYTEDGKNYIETLNSRYEVIMAEE